MPRPVPPLPVLVRRWCAGLALPGAVVVALLPAVPAQATAATPVARAYVQWLRDDPGAGAVQVGLLRARAEGGRAVVSGYVDVFDCPDGAVPSVDGGPCAYLGTRVLQGTGLLDSGAGLRDGLLTGEVTSYAGDAFGGDVGPEVGRDQVALRFAAVGAPAVAVSPCTDDPAARCRTASRAARVTSSSGLFADGMLSEGVLSSERPLG